MRARLAGLLRRLADRLEPVDTDPGPRWTPLPRPEPFTEPVDVEALWRGHVADYAACLADDDDEWRGGTYL